MKGILDRLDREEKQEQKRIKKQETAEEKAKRLAGAKLQTTLFKQKEALKKDMLKKRALLEKTLQSEVQVSFDIMGVP